MGAVLVDTSILVAIERGAEPPVAGVGALATVTLAELELGLLVADAPDARTRRAATLEIARGFEALPLTAAIAARIALIRADCRRARRRAPLADAIVAATAIEHGLQLLTQDADFEGIAAAHPALDVLRV